jgi:hypothetical protein
MVYRLLNLKNFSTFIMVFEAHIGTVSDVKEGDYMPCWRGTTEHEGKSYSRVIDIRPAEIGRDCALVLIKTLGPHVIVTYNEGAVEVPCSIWACNTKLTFLRDSAAPPFDILDQ